MNQSRDMSVLKRSIGASHLSVRAFTLVELLVVIAITSILLALLFGPIISSFNLTRRARSISQAQDAARFGIERLTRELGRATYIYDNGLTPIAIPMNMRFERNNTNTLIRLRPGDAVNDPIIVGGPNYADWVTGPETDPGKRSSLIAYGRIDLVQAAVRQDINDVIDPTTGQPVGGAELRPGVRGKRVTRYFLGLRYPKNPDGTVRFYENLYEFRRADEEHNPVILYRAEYDPTDPNLFDMSWNAGTRSRPTYNSTAPNSGGFNDPAFFYADKVADSTLTDNNGNPILDARGAPIRGNQRTYAENWQAISQPVLVSANVDLLRWNRVSPANLQTGQSTVAYSRDYKDARDPFSSTTTFAPVAIPGDVAAPGFLTSGGVETPAAVPSLYQTKYAAWTYPYTITVLRGSTNYNNTSPRTAEPFGALKLTVDREPDGDIFIAGIAGGDTFGTLATTAANLYTVYSPVTRKLFVKTPHLTFSIDADRGRIETAFPPLMGNLSGGVGVPYYLPASGTPTLVAPGLIPAAGELIQTRFKIDTRHPSAGTGGIALNQGILQTNLFTSSYQLDGALLTDPATMLSPLDVFGDTSGGGAKPRGVRIIVGSERLTAPVTTGGGQTSWSRIASVPSGGAQQPDSIYSGTAVPPTFTSVPERRPLYTFDYDFYTNTAAEDYEQLFRFDFANNPTGTPVPGSLSSGLAAADNFGVNFLTATYLWQNNYSRYPVSGDAYWGNPLDASGNRIQAGSAVRPEADIFRIDYATRQQYNINLGARVYDPTDGRAQTIQVADKVIINNVLR